MNTEAPANATDVIEESADSLIDFVHGIIPVDWLSTIVVVAIVVFVTAVIAHLATKLIRRILSTDASPLPSSSIFVNIVRVAIWAIGVSIMLSTCFNVNVTAAVAALGVGGIAISLGFQDTLSNLISGLQLSIMGIVEPGDNVEIGGQQGIVSDVTWRHTTIVSSTGERIMVPNSVLNTSSLIQLPPPRKVVVPVSVVASGDELTAVSDRMAQAALAAAQEVGGVEKEPSVQFTLMLVSMSMSLWHLIIMATSSSDVLPARSPMPLMVTSTCRAPFSTPAMVLAVAMPRSLWQCVEMTALWMPSTCSIKYLIFSPYSEGRQ